MFTFVEFLGGSFALCLIAYAIGMMVGCNMMSKVNDPKSNKGNQDISLLPFALYYATIKQYRKDDTMEEKKKKIQKASRKKIAYNNAYNREHYDRCNVMLEVGTKKRILATGESINTFINRLVMAELAKIEKEQRNLLLFLCPKIDFGMLGGY